jgi:hypothetical protein
MNDKLTTNASTEAESPAFLVGAVSGSISISNGTAINQKKIYSNSKWFDCEYYIIKIFDDHLVIKKCGLQIPKNARKLNNAKQLSIICDIPLGNFEFDEESNEDELVVYYR